MAEDKLTIFDPQVEYFTLEDAIEAVKIGDVWGYLAVPDHYSDSVYSRTASGNRVDEEALNGSFVHYQLDMTSEFILSN